MAHSYRSETVAVKDFVAKGDGEIAAKEQKDKEYETPRTWYSMEKLSFRSRCEEVLLILTKNIVF